MKNGGHVTLARHYNVVGPHGAIGNKTPTTLLNRTDATRPSRPLQLENASFRSGSVGERFRLNF